jgi:hypothetical protein
MGAVADAVPADEEKKTEENFSDSGDDPSGGIVPAGKYQLRVWVYSKNREKLPHSIFGAPNAPHRPSRSATADKKPTPSPALSSRVG